MTAAPSLEARAQALDEALTRVSTLSPEDRAIVEGALEALNSLHKEGLTTIVRSLRERSREVLFDLVDDPTVHMLLSMHGLIRSDPEAAAQATLERLRPELAERGVQITLAGLADGVASVRLSGLSGCERGQVVAGVESALKAAVPGLRGVETKADDVALIPVEALQVRGIG